ncbi:Serine/threonine/tyrosine-interacting protein [Halotydeus destructor]|nr:Serine/threonine/tyrosine-interacting protein [Halotydeus destructor]
MDVSTFEQSVSGAINNNGTMIPRMIRLEDIMDASDSTDWEYAMRRQMQQIVPGIYLGPYASAMRTQKENLKAQAITHIICIRSNIEAHLIRENFPGEFQYLSLDIADLPTQSIIPYFPKVKEFVDNCLINKGKVLFHGMAGISRSAALLAAYLMETTGCSSTDALKFIQKKRFCTFPNEGFRRQLLEYEPILSAKRTFYVSQCSTTRKRHFEEEIVAQMSCEMSYKH